MLKLLRNICIWMCCTSCLFGYATHAVPLEYFDDHEFSYDMDTAQSKVKYDPRQLSQQLKDQHNYPQERAAPCYSASNRYTHGQRVAREDPCEVCLCVDGEIFCWWKKCGNPKRRKFKLEKSAKLGKSKADKASEKKTHKEQQHLRQKKKLEKKLRQQHWQQQQQHELQLQRTGARNKILTFPENLPSVLYYDYKTDDQHGFQHGNHEKQAASSNSGGVTAGRRNNAHDYISATETIGSRESTNEEETDDDGHNVEDADGDVDVDADAREDGDDASSAIAAAAAVAEEPASTEMKFGAKIHSAAGASKKISLQQTSTARITTPGAVAPEPPSDAFPNEQIKDDRLSNNNQFISGHPVGDIEPLNIDSPAGQRIPDAVIQRNRTTTSTQGETAFMLMQSQEVDHDGILRDGPGGESTDGGPLGKYPSPPYNRQSNEQQPQLTGGAGASAGGGGTSFHSSFNDFSSEFNASAAVDLDLIMGHHNAHDAPIILEADSIVNASSSTSSSSSLALSLKQELGGPDSTNVNTGTSPSNRDNSSKDNPVLSTTTVASTTVNQEQECIVMGASYKIGAILPQETGNCLQCICIEGATKDDTPRVTCSPHNCPPLVLPDLFDATGY